MNKGDGLQWNLHLGNQSFKIGWLKNAQDMNGKMLLIERIITKENNKRNIWSLAIFMVFKNGRWGLGHFVRSQKQIKM